MSALIYDDFNERNLKQPLIHAHVLQRYLIWSSMLSSTLCDSLLFQLFYSY